MAYTPSFSPRPNLVRASGLKLPRDVSGDEVCRALKRMGFEEDKIVDRNSTPSQLEKAKFSEEFKRFAERHCLLLPDD